jgi:hypothetical protein
MRACKTISVCRHRPSIRIGNNVFYCNRLCSSEDSICAPQTLAPSAPQIPLLVTAVYDILDILTLSMPKIFWGYMIFSIKPDLIPRCARRFQQCLCGRTTKGFVRFVMKDVSARALVNCVLCL